MVLASLPADVVRIIVDASPLRPRLLVIARVCRRWRAVAYASVTAIEEPFAYHGPFERYPNLTACAFHAARGVPDDWTAEQRARVVSADFYVPRMARITGAIRLLRSASSLTDLTLIFSTTRAPRDKHVLPPLPALRSLEVYGCEGFVQKCCAPLLSQLTRLHTAFESMSLNPGIQPSQLPQLKALSLETVPRRVALAYAQAAHTRLVAMQLSADDYSFRTAPYRTAILSNSSLRHLVVFFCSAEFVEVISPLGSQLQSLELLEPATSEAAKDNGFESLAKHFSGITRLNLHSISETLNIAPLQSWHGVHLRELTSGSRSLQWVTAALRTFPVLAILRLGELSSGSNVTEAEINDFEAEVRKADRRGMEVIHANVVRSSATRYSPQCDMRRLQHRLQWLTFHVGTYVE